MSPWTPGVDVLLELGCDLVDANRLADAVDCFRRAADMGSRDAWFNLGNSLCACFGFVRRRMPTAPLSNSASMTHR